MYLGRKLVAAGVLVLATGRPAWSQARWPMGIEDPLLASLVAEALSKNPDVAAARQTAEAAGQRPTQARALANPMLSVVYTNDGWSPSLGSMEMTNLALMASQDLPYPGKRALRGEIATREAHQAQQQVARVSRGVTAAVKRAYYGLLLSRRLLDLTADQEDVWKQTEVVARTRYAVGQGAQPDILRVQVELTRIEQLRAEQEGEAEIRLAELNGLLARDPGAMLDTPSPLALRPVPFGLDQLFEWATGISPELGNAQLETERATLAVALAKKEWRPDFSVQTAYMNRGGLPPMWQAGMGVSVPAYRGRLAAGLAEARARRQSSRSAIESLRLQLRFRTQERLAQLRTTEKLAALYGEGIVLQDRMAFEATRANYETGKLPFVAVLEALTTFYADRATHLQLLARHEQILADIEEASLGAAPGAGAAGSSIGTPSMARPGGSSSIAATSGMGGR